MNAVERLQSHHIKPSVQRMAIMKYLMEHRTHPTVDEIYTSLAPEMPTLSKTCRRMLWQRFRRVFRTKNARSCARP